MISPGRKPRFELRLVQAGHRRARSCLLLPGSDEDSVIATVRCPRGPDYLYLGIEASQRHRGIGGMNCDANVGPAENRMTFVQSVERRAARAGCAFVTRQGTGASDRKYAQRVFCKTLPPRVARLRICAEAALRQASPSAAACAG